MADEASNDLTALTVDLLSAFVANNNVRTDDLPSLIAATHAALAGLSISDATPETETVAATPAAAVTAPKSPGSREHIISMIDGKPYKTLKRHLSGHGLTPKQYRERYSLPATYPMVAPAYSEARRETANRLGLGRKPAPAPAAAAPVEETPALAAVEPTAKTRRPKAAKAVAPESAKLADKPVRKSGRLKVAIPSDDTPQ